jgi:hypothetical protein
LRASKFAQHIWTACKVVTHNIVRVKNCATIWSIQYPIYTQHKMLTQKKSPMHRQNEMEYIDSGKVFVIVGEQHEIIAPIIVSTTSSRRYMTMPTQVMVLNVEKYQLFSSIYKKSVCFLYLPNALLSSYDSSSLSLFLLLSSFVTLLLFSVNSVPLGKSAWLLTIYTNNL